MIALWEQKVTYRKENNAHVGISKYGNRFHATLSVWNGTMPVTAGFRSCKSLAGAKRACTAWMKESAKSPHHIEWVQLI